ncbi:MAG: lytic transglycosylase domain-containing protein, partial [Polyangiales bacterium]
MSSAIGAAFLGLASLASVAVAAPGGSPSTSASGKPASSSATAKPASSGVSAKPSASAKADPKKKDDPKPKTLTTPNAGIQKKIAGGPTSTEVSGGAESTELKTLREAEIDLFAGAAPPPGQVWPSDLPSPPKGPLSMSGGLPPEPVTAPEVQADPVFGSSLAWLSGLKMPDLPVRWDTRVVKYLEFFKDDPRGRRIMTVWYKRSGRYRALITSMLRARSMPEDLAWLAMAESGFDPVIKSPAGATGLWQFMPDAGKIYGLSIDRWADGRNSPARATEAALNYLSDLKKRFGSWELAMAAYNMGYGGALATVKKFNSNDYWELSRFENGLPWETTLYVPKIIAVAIVARNPAVFGLDP